MIRAQSQMDIFDAPASKAAGIEGMERVMSNEPDFSAEFLAAIIRLPHGWIGQCEDIRSAWTGTIPHPNAWGACWNGAVRRGLLVDTQRETSMTAKRSHGRKTHLYRRV